MKWNDTGRKPGVRRYRFLGLNDSGMRIDIAYGSDLPLIIGIPVLISDAESLLLVQLWVDLRKIPSFRFKDRFLAAS